MGSGVVGYASAMRGCPSGKAEFVYTDGTSSPYSVKYGEGLLLPPSGGPRMMV